jgi:hypothetical protein
MKRRSFWAILAGCAGGGLLTFGLLVWYWSRLTSQEAPLAREIVEVNPEEDLQKILDEAARRPHKPIVRLHAGIYRPREPGEALIHFNARHDGITLEGDGEVILTAANPQWADARAESYPAIVNHVVYFGDGITEATCLRNVKITGANGFVRGPADLPVITSYDDVQRLSNYLVNESMIESPNLPKSLFFYRDGGGILIYGKSYPTIENVEVSDNYGPVCGAGVSVQHTPSSTLVDAVHFQNCIFRNNRTGISGSGLDLLTRGSWAILDNCLFIGNVSDARVFSTQNNRFGALTVFPNARAEVRNCTFADNWSGVDDRGESTYKNTLFWNNKRPGGLNPKPPFDIRIYHASGVEGCRFGFGGGDLSGRVSRTNNRFDGPDPEFDREFRPQNSFYEGVGYRP